MKIALVTKDFLPDRGGMERYAQGITRMFLQEGHEVHIISPKFDATLPENAFAHIVCPEWYCKIIPKAYRLVPAIRKVIHKLNCDIVYALTAYYPADVYRAGDGVLEHWLQLKYRHFLPRWIAKSMPRRCAFSIMEHKLFGKNCKAIITNSKLVKCHILEYYQFPHEHIHVVYNGVDHSIFYPGTMEQKLQNKAQLGISEKAMSILFVAHNWERKGLETLLRGAARLVRDKKAVIHVVGRGKPYKWQRLLQYLKINEGVIFIESTKNIGDWYRKSDLMVLPTHYDPFANVCLEAMACGIPVVTSRENGTAELITPGINGYIMSSPYGHKELEEQLISLQDENLRISMGKQARRDSLALTLEENGRRTVEICRKYLHH